MTDKRTQQLDAAIELGNSGVKVGAVYQHFKGDIYIITAVDIDADCNELAFRVVYAKALLSTIDPTTREERKAFPQPCDLTTQSAWDRLCCDGKRFSRSFRSFVEIITKPDISPTPFRRFTRVTPSSFSPHVQPPYPQQQS